MKTKKTVRRTKAIWVTRDEGSGDAGVEIRVLKPVRRGACYFTMDGDENSGINVCHKFFSAATGIKVPAGGCLKIRLSAEVLEAKP